MFLLFDSGIIMLVGSSKRSEPKQVMFSDGIRPGGDLTELDGSDTANKLPPRRTSRAQKRVDRGSPGRYFYKFLLLLDIVK